MLCLCYLYHSPALICSWENSLFVSHFLHVLSIIASNPLSLCFSNKDSLNKVFIQLKKNNNNTFPDLSSRWQHQHETIDRKHKLTWNDNEAVHLQLLVLRFPGSLCWNSAPFRWVNNKCGVVNLFVFNCELNWPIGSSRALPVEVWLTATKAIAEYYPRLLPCRKVKPSTTLVLIGACLYKRCTDHDF